MNKQARLQSLNTLVRLLIMLRNRIDYYHAYANVIGVQPTDFLALFVKPRRHKSHFLFKSMVRVPSGEGLTPLLFVAFHQVTAIRYHEGQVTWLHFGFTTVP